MTIGINCLVLLCDLQLNFLRSLFLRIACARHKGEKLLSVETWKTLIYLFCRLIWNETAKKSNWMERMSNKFQYIHKLKSRSCIRNSNSTWFSVHFYWENEIWIWHDAGQRLASSGFLQLFSLSTVNWQIFCMLFPPAIQLKCEKGIAARDHADSSEKHLKVAINGL